MAPLPGPLKQRHAWHLDEAPEVVLARLGEAVHLHTGPFRIIFKLSGGGIVTRVMEHPFTELPWFGEATAERLRLVAVPAGSDVTPYQPILRGRVLAEDGGSIVELELEPHPGANTFAIPFALLGLVLLGYALIFLGTAPIVAGVSAVFGIAFLTFPTLRSRLSFQRDCARDLARLRETLAAEPQTSPQG